MYLTTKSGRKVLLPSTEEDDEINAQIAADPDDSELDGEWFKNARPASDVLYEILPASVADAMLKKPLGRPKTIAPKVPLNMRVDADIMDSLKATGRGWQTRVNKLLRKHLDEIIG